MCQLGDRMVQQSEYSYLIAVNAPKIHSAVMSWGRFALNILFVGLAWLAFAGLVFAAYAIAGE